MYNNLSNLKLDLPVSNIPQVSITRTNALNQLGISNIRDLLYYFPINYIDLSNYVKISQAKCGYKNTICAEVYDIKKKEPKKGIVLIEITLVDDSGTLIVTLFKQLWLIKKIQKGNKVYAIGTVEFNYGFKRMTNPIIQVFETDNQDDNPENIISIYNAGDNISSSWIRRIIKLCIDYIGYVPTFIPQKYIKKYKLLNLWDAIKMIHFPKCINQIALAKRSLKYMQVFKQQVYINKWNICNNVNSFTREHNICGNTLGKVLDSINIKFSSYESYIFSKIISKFAQNKTDKHLLICDDFYKKICFMALFVAISFDSGYQSLIVFQSINLAKQCFEIFNSLLRKLSINTAIFTGDIRYEDKINILSNYNNSKINCIVADKNIIDEKFTTSKCSLIIVDEAHFLTLNQLQSLYKKFSFFLKEKGTRIPDFLYTSSLVYSPSLISILYGNIDKSYIPAKEQNKALSLQIQKLLKSPPGKIPFCKNRGLNILNLINAEADKAIINTAVVDAEHELKQDVNLQNKENSILSYEVSRI